MTEDRMQSLLLQALDLMGYSKRIVIGTTALLSEEELAAEMLMFLKDNRDATEEEIINKTAEILKSRESKKKNSFPATDVSVDTNARTPETNRDMSSNVSIGED